MKFFNRGQAKKSDDGSHDHPSGPPSLDVPGFIVALNAGGKLPFFEDWTPEDPPEEEFEEEFEEEPELM